MGGPGRPKLSASDGLDVTTISMVVDPCMMFRPVIQQKDMVH